MESYARRCLVAVGSSKTDICLVPRESWSSQVDVFYANRCVVVLSVSSGDPLSASRQFQGTEVSSHKQNRECALSLVYTRETNIRILASFI